MKLRVVSTGEGFLLLRDNEALLTPGGAALLMPVKPLASALANELSAANPRSSPVVGPLGHLSVLALDRVRTDRPVYLADVLAYRNSDLLSHRAEGPSELIQRQAAYWDPVLDWALATLGAELEVGVGIVPVNQSEAALAALESAVHGILSETPSLDFALAAIGEMTALSGSLVLALATAREWLPVTEAWSISILDENWQEERWGIDQEARTAQEQRRLRFFVAAECIRVLREGSTGSYLSSATGFGPTAWMDGRPWYFGTDGKQDFLATSLTSFPHVLFRKFRKGWELPGRSNCLAGFWRGTVAAVPMASIDPHGVGEPVSSSRDDVMVEALSDVEDVLRFGVELRLCMRDQIFKVASVGLV